MMTIEVMSGAPDDARTSTSLPRAVGLIEKAIAGVAPDPHARRPGRGDRARCPAGAARAGVARATESALKVALARRGALAWTRRARPARSSPPTGCTRPPPPRSGAIGGAFGFAALAVELPISTTILLRSIAEIARAEGEDLSRPEARLACLEVFALGGQKPDEAGARRRLSRRARRARAIGQRERAVPGADRALPARRRRSSCA